MPVSTDKLCFLKSLDFFFSLLCVLQQISIPLHFSGYFARERLFFLFPLKFCAGNQREPTIIYPLAHARRLTSALVLCK